MKYILWFLSILIGLNSEIAAQSVAAPSGFQVLATINSTDTNNIFGDTLFFPVTHYSGTAVITLTDTVTVNKINLYLGSASSTWSLLSKTFKFDSAGTFLDGTSYLRQGYNVYLGLGNYSGQDSIYSKVTLQNGAGTLSSPVFFSQAISNSSSPTAGIDTATIFH